MKITLNANPDNAPGCVLIESADNRDRLVQLDYDWPGVAVVFGWNIRDVQIDGKECPHSGTDGTISCHACGLTAGDFIVAARNWIDDNDGATADDPGYFDDEPSDTKTHDGHSCGCKSFDDCPGR